MALENIQRKFALSYEQVAAKAENLLLAATRDLADLDEYGINSTLLTAFSTKFEDVTSLKIDDVWVQEVAIKNQEVYLTAALLRTMIRGIVGRAALVFGENSLQVKTFRAEQLTRQSARRLIDTAKNVIIKAGEYLSQLAVRGLTQDIIDNLEATLAVYETKRAAANSHSDARSIAAQERLIAYNSLYDDMVVIAGAGKLKFGETDPARYQDYVIYDTFGGANTPPAAPVITSISEGILTLFTDPSTTSNQVQDSVDGVHWEFVEEHLEGNTCPIEPPSDGEKHFRARSNNAAGFSEWSAVSTISAHLEAPIDPHFDHGTGTFMWGESEGATRYNLRYRASGSTGGYTEVMDSHVTEYVWTPPVGEWEFQIRAESNENTSPWVTFFVTID
jgi:hypothetical protein